VFVTETCTARRGRHLGSALFWDIMQRRVANSTRRRVTPRILHSVMQQTLSTRRRVTPRILHSVVRQTISTRRRVTPRILHSVVRQTAHVAASHPGYYTASCGKHLAHDAASHPGGVRISSTWRQTFVFPSVCPLCVHTAGQEKINGF
jgi:hypothetical protein